MIHETCLEQLKNHVGDGGPQLNRRWLKIPVSQARKPYKLSEATFKQKTYGQIGAMVFPRVLDVMNLRICHYDRAADPARPEYNEHVIYVFWHEYIGVVLPRWGHTPITVLCSHHKDGEIVNQASLALGLHIVRGSSNRGGSSAIRQMKQNAKFSSIAVTPDGPRGPRREMAIGPVYLSSLLKMPIVPIGVGISNVHRLDTWDQFAIPRPLSRIRMIFAPKVRIPAKLDRDKLEDCRLDLQKLLNDVTSEAESWANSGKKLKGQQPFVRARRCNKKVFETHVESKPGPNLSSFPRPSQKAA